MRLLPRRLIPVKTAFLPSGLAARERQRQEANRNQFSHSIYFRCSWSMIDWDQ
jgi:hypothetical protein